MEISVLALTGIGLGAMFFGYFFGLFEGRGQGYRRGRKEGAETRGLAATPRDQPSEPGQRGEGGILVLGRDAGGNTTIKLEGRTIPAAKVTPDERKRLIELMVMLKPWIEPQTPAARSTAGQGAAQAAGVTGSTQRAPAVEGAMPANRPAEAERAQPEASHAHPGTSSLVEQIDQVLQERMAGTPLAERGIRLVESLHGGALVIIGQRQYDGVDEVPDSEIKAVIRAAIADWEKRYTPG